MNSNRQRFRESIKQFYSKDSLFKLYKTYFKNWIAEGFIGSNLGLFEIAMITENSNLQTFLDLYEQMFKESNFPYIYEILPEEVKIVFNDIAWKGKHYIKDNRMLYLVTGKSYDINKDLKDEFLFFKAEKDYKKEEYLTLDYNIVRVLRKLIPDKPKDYFIHPAEVKGSLFSCNDEKLFMENIKIYYNFYQQGGVSLSASGKILKESKINMKKYCNIQEYYDQDFKDLQYLKTETIGLFFHLIKDDFINHDTFKVSNIKDLVHLFFSGTIIKNEKFHYSFLYLNYLKGLKNISDSDEKLKKGLETILKVIKEFSVTENYNPTISLKNIINRIILQDEFIEIIDVESAYSHIYINEANYERTKITSYDKYIDFVIIPFIKSVFFILGIMGVVELKFDAPSSNNSLYLKNGHLSKYDGLKYVKLTEFGKYVFGISDYYDFKDLKDEGEVHLDEERLIITILGEAPSKTMFFEKISHKITNNKFRVSREVFLKDISTKHELEDRIKAFTEKVDCNIPEIWKDFFEELVHKSTLINIVSDYTVLKLGNEKNLLTSISTDERFKNLILKGENYHIIVKNENISKVINLFKEYGYNINTYLN